MSIRPVHLGTATIVGAVLFLAGQAMLPSLPTDIESAFAGMIEHRDRLMAARLLSSAGAFLLVPAAVGIALLFRGTRGSRLVLVATVLIGVATFSNAVSQAVAGYAAWGATAPGFDRTSGRTLVEHIDDGLVGIPVGFWSIPAFALGWLLLAVALLRSGRVATWIPVVLIVGDVMAGAFAGRGYVVALTQAPITVALIALGVHVARGKLPDSAHARATAGARLS